MDNHSDSGSSRVILIVGLGNAIALLACFALLTTTVTTTSRDLTKALREKVFAYPNYPVPATPPSQSVINLSNGRFVVVDQGIIGLYQVDGKNQIKTLSTTRVAVGAG